MSLLALSGFSRVAQPPLKSLANESEPRRNLFENAACFRGGLKENGYDVKKSQSPIVTIYLEDEDLLVDRLTR